MPDQRESRPARGGEAASIPANHVPPEILLSGLCCLLCDRPLHSAASRRRGIGPTCWRRLRAPAVAAATSGGLPALGALAQTLAERGDVAGHVGVLACSELAIDWGLA